MTGPPRALISSRLLRTFSWACPRGATNTDVEQSFYIIEESERLDAVVRIIDSEEPTKAILFCRTKRETDELNEVLVA